MKIQFYQILLLCLTIFSCGSSTEEILQEDTAEIISYLDDNGLLEEAEVNSSGLYYIIQEAGNDTHPGLNSQVECNYKGYFPNGEVFDSNSNAIFTLGATIEGWRQGIPLIGEGGSVQLFVPSGLAYGKTGTSSGSIPENQIIFFDVDLIKVN